jgi:hypothetical protein
VQEHPPSPYTRTRLLGRLAQFGVRSTFLESVHSERRGTLANCLASPVAQALSVALPQVSAAAPRELARHPFTLSRVTDLSGRHSSLYPTALISPVYSGLEHERDWLGHCEGDDCAVHFDAWLAQRSAAHAFLGRQYLLAAFLGAALRELDLGGYADLDPRALCLATDLRALGVLRAFASCEPGRGYFCLVLFQAGAGAGLHPCTAVGSAYRAAPLRAFTRALESLWHAIRVQTEITAEEGSPRSDAKPPRASSNDQDTPAAFPCWDRRARDPLPLPSFLALAEAQGDDPLAALRGRSASMLLYRAQSQSRAMVKVLDPGFYLHSELTRALNYDNRFAQRWARQAARALDRVRGRPTFR